MGSTPADRIEIHTEHTRDAIVLHPSCVLDSFEHTKSIMLELLGLPEERVFVEPRPIIVDLAGVPDMEYGAICALLRLARERRENKLSLKLCAATGPVAKLLHRVHVENTPFYSPTVECALRAPSS